MLSVLERFNLIVSVQKLTAERDFHAVIDLLEPLADAVFREPELGHALALAFSQCDRQREADRLLARLDAVSANHGTNRLQRRRENLRAVALLRQGNLERAEQALLDVQSASHLAGDGTFLATATMNLGVIADMRCDWDAALSYYNHALVEFQRLGDRASTAGCYHNLGMLHRQRGDLEEAANCFELAIEHYAPNGTEEERIATDLERSLVMVARGDADAALALCRRTLQRSITLANQRLQTEAMRTEGKVLAQRGDYSAAREVLLSAVRVDAAVVNRMLYAEIHEELSVVNAALGCLPDCEGMLEIACTSYEEMGLTERAERARERVLVGSGRGDEGVH